MPVLYGHTGNLLTVLDCIQDVQIAAGDLYGAYWPLKGSLLYSLHCCGCDLIGAVPELSGLHPGQDIHQQGICINIGFSGLIVQLEIVICQAGDPAMAGCIQLGCHKYCTCEGVVFSVYIEG